ncbi:MAG: DUF3105 domain-containing protein [Caldilineaceae bacterium]
MAEKSNAHSARVTLAQQARARRQTKQRWLWVGGLLVLLVIVGAFLLLRRNSATQTSTAQTNSAATNLPATDSNGEIRSLQKFPNLTAGDHQIGQLSYPQTPPVGGPHNPAWQNCGIYDKPVANENAVHSLEHGAVWMTYRPDLPAAEVDKLRALIRGHDHGLLSPYQNLPAPIVISAWGLQLQVQSADDPRLPLFIKKYENGAQTPEPGATCSGAVGTPIQ